MSHRPSNLSMFLLVPLMHLPSLLVGQVPLQIPMVEYHACPFEFGCNYLKWVAHARRQLYKSDGDTSTIAYWMAPGDSLTFNDANMYIDPIGRAVLRRSTDKFRVGDTVYILSYTGEGFYSFWHEGKVYNEESFWATYEDPEDTVWSAQLINWPRMTWWVSLTNANNQVGWLPLVNTCVSMGACFGDSSIEIRRKDTFGFE